VGRINDILYQGNGNDRVSDLQEACPVQTCSSDDEHTQNPNNFSTKTFSRRVHH
jgi:hypothetical protein